MPVEMAMWKMTSDGPLAIAPKMLNFEDRLEELVVNDPSLINLSIHVIELKRDRRPREVVAQILDYGSWAPESQRGHRALRRAPGWGAGRGIRRDIRKRCT